MCLAIPGKLVTMEGDTPETRTGTVDFGGIQRVINLAYVPEAEIGNYVLVHVGFGLAVIDEVEAEKTQALLEELGEFEEGDGRRKEGVGGWEE
ncbi:MAG: HypC/HybG/HupF family hydrogenase formation chaperone [Myxococcota bacterium]